MSKYFSLSNWKSVFKNLNRKMVCLFCFTFYFLKFSRNKEIKNIKKFACVLKGNREIEFYDYFVEVKFYVYMSSLGK